MIVDLKPKHFGAASRTHSTGVTRRGFPTTFRFTFVLVHFPDLLRIVCNDWADGPAAGHASTGSGEGARTGGRESGSSSGYVSSDALDCLELLIGFADPPRADGAQGTKPARLSDVCALRVPRRGGTAFRRQDVRDVVRDELRWNGELYPLLTDSVSTPHTLVLAQKMDGAATNFGATASGLGATMKTEGDGAFKPTQVIYLTGKQERVYISNVQDAHIYITEREENVLREDLQTKAHDPPVFLLIESTLRSQIVVAWNII